jgi:hypothetical protein
MAAAAGAGVGAGARADEKKKTSGFVKAQVGKADVNAWQTVVGPFVGSGLKDTGAPIPSRVVVHSLVHTPLLPRVDAPAVLQCKLDTVTNFTELREAMDPDAFGKRLTEYIPLDLHGDMYVRVKAGMLNFEQLIDAYLRMSAAAVLATNPAVMGEYDDDFYSRRAEWLANAIRVHMFVGVTVLAGRIRQRTKDADPSLPEHVLWHIGVDDKFQETAVQRIDAKLDLRNEQKIRDAEAMANSILGAPVSYPFASPADAAAAAVAAGPIPATPQLLAAAICDTMTDERAGSRDERVKRVKAMCASFMRAGLERHNSKCIGPAIRHAMAALLFVLWIEMPQLCDGYPYHVESASEKGLHQSRGQKEARAQRQRCASVFTRESITALMKHAMKLVAQKTEDLQKNTAHVLFQMGAMMHSIRTDKTCAGFVCEPLKKSLGTSKCDANKFTCTTTPRWHAKGSSVVAPVLFSIARLQGLLDVFGPILEPPLTGISLIIRGDTECALTTEVSKSDKVLVKNVSPREDVLHADWLLRWSCAHKTRLGPSAASRKKQSQDTPPEAAAAAASAAESALSKSPEYRRSGIERRGSGVPYNILWSLFRSGDVWTDCKERYGTETIPTAGLRLAELLILRPPCRHDGRQNQHDHWVLRALTGGLFDPLMLWLHVAPPNVPPELYARVRDGILYLPRSDETFVPETKSQHKDLGIRAHIVRHFVSLGIFGRYGDDLFGDVDQGPRYQFRLRSEHLATTNTVTTATLIPLMGTVSITGRLVFLNTATCAAGADARFLPLWREPERKVLVRSLADDVCKAHPECKTVKGLFPCLLALMTSDNPKYREFAHPIAFRNFTRPQTLMYQRAEYTLALSTSMWYWKHEQRHPDVGVAVPSVVHYKPKPDVIGATLRKIVGVLWKAVHKHRLAEQLRKVDPLGLDAKSRKILRALSRLDTKSPVSKTTLATLHDLGLLR